ncbi:MAG: carbamoyltransferase HypF [Promethearchaeota archaeon]|nr:MAG: carbamoyltransferase HypF [Candidatus Lokiarchaeota archaeon]
MFETLKNQIPSVAFIEEISMKKERANPNVNYTSLTIVKSNSGTGKGLTLPPDIGICHKCLQDFNNSSVSRFYEYPFVACAECGPRFTIMRALPYDRPNSTVDIFPFCEECEGDYKNFDDRRFHAQTFNCKQCGPFYYKYQPDQRLPSHPQAGVLEDIVADIKNSKIVALKGIGGVNLLCRGDDEKAIDLLRDRKRERKFKPFAVMMPDVETVREHFDVTPGQITLLQSFRKPIVILPKRKGHIGLPENIAPGLPNIGVILPYMGIHSYLFNKLGNLPLIFTSGNVTSIPMAIENQLIGDQMSHLADSIYLHNREIYQRCDDSVIRPSGNSNLLIRRSRGFVPEYYKLPFKSAFSSIIGVGAELNSTGGISRQERIFPTQHIGNVRNLDTYEFLEQSLHHMQQLLQIDDHEIEVIGHDLHPLFYSTKLAHSMKKQLELSSSLSNQPNLFGIQHHHAHFASLMVDHKLGIDERLVTITADGVGYGTDGTSWGGEILFGGYTESHRKSNIRPIPMVGGDLCAKYPDRMLLSLCLNVAHRRNDFDFIDTLNTVHHFPQYFPHGKEEYDFIVNQFQYTGNSPTSQKTHFSLTSSLGRCLDAISAVFNICHLRTYRGEPAMRLEGFIWNQPRRDIVNLDDYIVDNQLAIDEMIYDYIRIYISSSMKKSKKESQILARSLVEDIALLFAKQAISVAEREGVRRIGFSGGVAYNEIITGVLQNQISGANLQFLQHNDVPPGDAGISIGQIAIIAANRNIP